MIGREVKYEVFDDTVGKSETPEVFKARKEIVNGKEIVVVQTRNEVVIGPDGSRNVTIHAPSLDLMNKFQEKNS